MRALLLIADFANAESGKLNVIGGGWQVTARSLEGNQLIVPPQAVVAMFEVPPEFINQQFSVTLVLEDSRGNPVELPGPAGPQALRIGHVVSAPPSNIRGVPPGRVPGRAQIMVNIHPGLPLSADELHTWVLEVDGYRNPQWRTSFYVLPDPTAPSGAPDPGAVAP